ncbi:substrate import-associated zinc metallohydrolase lipoprotein [Reichenbachiella sp. MALMAid0571]|uniref:substrate import-associated zinc metallohydrolase lipoprotein n=1 Tax=Reichenbachiella sp. MALMAid0571 TaxID=3143939 RepID=UPI0032DEF987
MYKIYSTQTQKLKLKSWALLPLFLVACYPSEDLNVPVKDADSIPATELDIYIQEEFIDKYDMAIRYRYVDNYVNPGERVAPPDIDNVRPMLDFIEDFWINPYLEIENGEAFFKEHVPPEIIFLGGLIYNSDGTVTLGTADAGARITFTNVNGINPEDESWVSQQLNVVYHEFAHTIHQRYKLPASFETISPSGYTSSGAWFTLTDEEALRRGFVSPYATSNPNEDFAETVSFFLFDKGFYENYITLEEDCTDIDCEERNEGRKKINQKLNAIIDHYEKVVAISLEELRAAIQSRLG